MKICIDYAEGLKRQDKFMADWIDDDDASLELVDANMEPLLERHPFVNADRGNQADVNDLADSMDAKGWCEGVGGVPFAVRQKDSKDPRNSPSLIIGKRVNP